MSEATDDKSLGCWAISKNFIRAMKRRAFGYIERNVKQILCGLILTVMTPCGLYLAASGWVISNLDAQIEKSVSQGGTNTYSVVYQGVTFADIYNARRAIEQDKVQNYFAWVYSLPDSLPLLITSLAFGLLGGVLNVLHKVCGGEPVLCRRLLLKPIFGSLVGLMVLGVANILPSALVVDGKALRPFSLAFLCLFAGAFSNRVYTWAEEKIAAIFTVKSDQPDK